MKVQTFKHKKLVDLYTDREEVSKEINAIVDEMVKLEKTRDKVAIKLQKQKEKMMPIMEKDIISQIELGEFEEVAKVSKKDGEIQVEIVDKVEEFKKSYLEAKAKLVK